MDVYSLSTSQLIGVYTPLTIAAIYVLVAHQGRFSDAGRARGFVCMCTSLISLIACTIIGFLIAEPGVQTLAVNASMVFTALWFSAQTLFCIWFYREDYKVPAYLSALLFVFPALFAIVALSPLYFMVVELINMIQTDAEVAFPVVDFVFPGWNMWVFAFEIYIQIMVVSAVLITLVGHIKNHRFNKLPSWLLLGAVVLSTGGTTLSTLEILPPDIDITIIAATVALVIFYIVALSHGRSFYSRYARMAAFRFLKDFVIIFDKSNRVSDFNPSAEKWFSSVGIDLHKLTFSSLMSKLKDVGGKISSVPGTDEGDDITISRSDMSMVLNMRIYDLSGKATRSKHGIIVFFFDVTQNREMLYMLEKKAGVDVLSGLPNRMAYEGAKMRYNKDPYHLPLSIIVGDLNGLKAINDRAGHKYGDLLVQSAAKICEEECKKPNFVARVGGDEFVFLLSQTDEEQANALISKLKNTMAEKSKDLPFRVSMAMGAATKYNMAQSLDEVLNLADKHMYEDKRAMKAERKA